MQIDASAAFGSLIDSPSSRLYMHAKARKAAGSLLSLARAGRALGSLAGGQAVMHVALFSSSFYGSHLMPIAMQKAPKRSPAPPSSQPVSLELRLPGRGPPIICRSGGQSCCPHDTRCTAVLLVPASWTGSRLAARLPAQGSGACAVLSDGNVSVMSSVRAKAAASRHDACVHSCYATIVFSRRCKVKVTTPPRA